MPSFAVRNFGCRVNQAEAFAWADAFRERGARLDEDWARSDIVIVNSCTLTGRAERDVRKFIRAVHRENSQAKIVVTGCYAERVPAEIAALPGVSAVLPQSAKNGLAERILAIGETGGPARESPCGPWVFDRQACLDHRAEDPRDDAARRPTEPLAAAFAGASCRSDVEPSFRARGWIKVQDGCDEHCTFCVIPSVRGRGRSVPAAEIAEAVGDLADRGFREIVLAGIHLSSYGEDLEPRTSLSSLLCGLQEAAKPARLRLSSLDPRKTDRALMCRIASDPHVCPHFHFSLQHVSTRVLGQMGRPVEAGSYEALLEEAARLSPDAALGADIMVGFPGETESDFEELKAFIERSPLTYAHVFSYSARPGTPAVKRRQLPSGLVTERAKAVRRLAALKDFAFRRRFIGCALEAVVIDRTDKSAEVLTGNFIRVLVPNGTAPERKLVRVAVRKVLPRRTEGEIVS